MAGRKKNPSGIRLSTAFGAVLSDYYAVSPNIEHVAACAIRGERAEEEVVAKAIKDLRRSAKRQDEEEAEQMEDLASSLEEELGRSGTRPTKKRTLNPREDAAKRSERRKNPSAMTRVIPTLSDDELDREHKAVTSLIARSKTVKGTTRMRRDLLSIRKNIVEEKARRRKENPSSANGRGLAPELRKFAKRFVNAKDEYTWLATSSSRNVMPGDLAQARRKMEAANDALLIYADAAGLEASDIKSAIRHASANSKGPSSYAKKYSKPRRKNNPSAKAPKWKKMIDECDDLMGRHIRRPTKTSLRALFRHIDKMEESRSSKVHAAARRAKLTANKEARRMGF